MQRTISRASLILGAMSQHLFGGARDAAYHRAAQSNRHVQSATARHAGSKPAGTRGMHSSQFTMPFRPMAHGKLGKKSGRGKRETREMQRGYAQELNFAALDRLLLAQDA